MTLLKIRCFTPDSLHDNQYGTVGMVYDIGKSPAVEHPVITYSGMQLLIFSSSESSAHRRGLDSALSKAIRAASSSSRPLSASCSVVGCGFKIASVSFS